MARNSLKRKVSRLSHPTPPPLPAKAAGTASAPRGSMQTAKAPRPGRRPVPTKEELAEAMRLRNAANRMASGPRTPAGALTLASTLNTFRTLDAAEEHLRARARAGFLNARNALDLLVATRKANA
ncbi:hypothetical protein [Streptomyces hydrogenans]